MHRLQRSRALFRGLTPFSAAKCIAALVAIRFRRKTPDFEIRYRKSGRRLRARVRGEHLSSDIQTVLELAAGDRYGLTDFIWDPEIVIDAGANTGLFSLAALARWPTARVLAFEPVPHNLTAVRTHLSLNNIDSRVELVAAAVSAKTGTLDFYVRDANAGSFSPNQPYTASISVPVFRLWDIYKPLASQRTLVKLDIEGAEFKVLEDFLNHQLKGIVFVLEVHGNQKEQDNLFSSALRAGLRGHFWERSNQTAHLLLTSPDVPESLLPAPVIDGMMHEPA